MRETQDFSARIKSTQQNLADNDSDFKSKLNFKVYYAVVENDNYEEVQLMPRNPKYHGVTYFVTQEVNKNPALRVENLMMDVAYYGDGSDGITRQGEYDGIAELFEKFAFGW